MSEPTTQAGRALMARWYADWTGTGELRHLIVAIEAEARAEGAPACTVDCDACRDWLEHGQDDV